MEIKPNDQLRICVWLRYENDEIELTDFTNCEQKN